MPKRKVEVLDEDGVKSKGEIGIDKKLNKGVKESKEHSEGVEQNNLVEKTNDGEEERLKQVARKNKRKVQNQKYRLKHKDEIKTQKCIYYQENKKEIITKSIRYNQENKNEISIKKKETRKNWSPNTKKAKLEKKRISNQKYNKKRKDKKAAEKVKMQQEKDKKEEKELTN